VTRPSVPRYCQEVVPGGATATWLVPGRAYGDDRPGDAWTVPPVPTMNSVPVPDRVRATFRTYPEIPRVPFPSRAAAR
jgi:hypothetical protein